MKTIVAIVANENIRIDSSDYKRDEHLATVDSDIPLGTLANMIQMGQARIVRKSQRDGEAPAETKTDDESPTDPDYLTNESALGSFGISDRIVDMLAASDPPILTKSDVIAYLANHRDLTKVQGIGKTTSNQVLEQLGLK